MYKKFLRSLFVVACILNVKGDTTSYAASDDAESREAPIPADPAAPLPPSIQRAFRAADQILYHQLEALPDPTKVIGIPQERRLFILKTISKQESSKKTAKLAAELNLLNFI